MSETRAALLIGCAEYEDSGFRQLPMASHDLEALARVLNDPTIGDFTVNTLLGNQSGAVKRAIEGFFADRKPDDLLLLYFSCHGVLDSGRQLHFVAHETNKQLLDSTGISAQWVKERMDRSRSQRIVLLLDCCYSGAFTRSLVYRDPGDKEILEQLSGRGRMVITASGKTEFAYESKFTDAVVQGLETGAADLDGDGQVSVCELYQYVYEQVRQNTQGQTPTMSADGMRGQLYLAKNPHAPLPLPAVIEKALQSKIIRERLWAVDGLRYLLAGDHPGGQKRTARQALLSLRDGDNDPVVRSAATETLSKVHQSSGVTANRRWGNRLAKVSLVAVVLAVLAVVVWGPFFPATEAEPGACSPRNKGADGVLSLGTLLSKTGPLVYIDPALDAGVQLAIKDINAAGGVPGITVKLDPANQRDQGNPSAETAGRSTDALLEGGVDAIIGPATSEMAVKLIDRVVCAGVIMFAPSNASPVLTTWPDHGLYFRTMSPSDTEASVLGKLVVNDGNSTVVVISRNDVYANPLREMIVKVIQESGGQVLDSFHYDQNALDFENYVQRAKAKNPDAIVLIGFAESAPILVNMIEEGLGPKDKRVYSTNVTNTLAGRVSPRDPSVLAGLRGTLPEAGSEAFVKQLREANPGLQDLTYAAHSYDSVVITALAAAVAGTDDPAYIAKEINGVTKAGEKCTSFAACLTLVKDGKDIDYDGASGPLEFTDPGEPSSITYVINEIQSDGTVKSLSSEQPGP